MGGDHNNLFFGISIRPIDNLNLDQCLEKFALGFSPGRGACVNGNLEPYGKSVHIGDVVTMIVDRVHGALRYQINGVDQGVLFHNDSLKSG